MRNRTGALVRVLLMAALLVAPCQFGELKGTQAQTPAPQQQQRPRASTPATPNTAAPAQQDDDDDVVRVETDLTNILMTAVDKNKRFITTLRQEDVRVLENGAPQQISIFQRETDFHLRRPPGV